VVRVRFGAAVVAVALVVAACGSSGSSAVPATAGQSQAPAASAATSGGDVVPSFVMPAGGNGACSVNIAGAVSRSWTGKQDMGTLEISQWLGESSRSMLQLKPGDEMFILNCKGDTGSIDFTSPQGTTESQFPKVGDSVVAAGGILGGGDAGQLSVLVNLKDQQLWHVKAPGTFTVTTFGGSRFAGTFKFTITSDAGDADVTGQFDLSCTGDACK